MIELSNEQISKIKNYEMYIMNNIHKICIKNNICYSLFYGSLIGAVRHHGFIPWDDDIDIIMSEKEYKRFKLVCKNELPNDLFLQDSETEPNSCLKNIAKIRIENTVLLEPANKRNKMHHGVWVDIFIYKTYDGNVSIIKKGRKKYCIYKKRVNASFFKKKSFKGKIASLLFILRHPLSCNYYKKVVGTFFDSIPNSGNYVIMPNFEPKMEYVSLNTLSAVKEISFENSNFFIIKDYDVILKKIYGDYMKLPKEEERIANHQYEKVEL